ncbi:MAG: LPXTG cell wall anchor domain-containing protein [Actinomycetota bacterium]|nr:LPXTG cell wall anchor domain-containing protein [Actinomycetota bacterium]
MPISRRIAAVILAAVLSMPAAALAQAQTQPLPSDEPGSSRPPVDLSGGERGSAQNSGSQNASELPDTGSDPRMLILAGAALTLLGVGLRLRTADADLY